MKHSTALKMVRQALKKVDKRLRVTIIWPEGRLPHTPKKEVCLSINTGPGTMMVHSWIKEGQLQTDEVHGYSYIDLNDSNAIKKWAQARKSLIRSQEFKAARDRHTKNGKIDWKAINKELGIPEEPMPKWLKNLSKRTK